MVEEDIPLWELLGYSSEEEFIKDDEKEKDQILRNTEQVRADEEAVLKAIESGEYAPEVNEEESKERQAIVDAQYLEFEQKKQRTFDEIIEKFAPVLVGLKGDSYKTATKMIFYSVLANQLKRNTFTLDGKKIDLRVPLIIMMKAGHGKKSYEAFIKRTIQGIDKMYAEPTSYVSEQFVGKVLVDESRDPNDPGRYTQVPGYLGSDFVVVDEAFELLTVDSQNHQETLKYIRTALDPIGDNEVEKKQVAIPYDYRLRYFPEGTIVLMTQLINQVNEKLLIKGSFRRFSIVMVHTPMDERLDAVTSGEFLIEKEDINKKIWQIWIRENKRLSERRIIFSGKSEDFKIIDHYIISNIAELHKDADKSDEAIEFTNTMLFNMKQTIFKMAAIRACIEQMNTDNVIIEKRNIEGAIHDYNILWEPQVNWIRQNMVMLSNHPPGWKDDLHGWIMRGLDTKGWIDQSKLVKIYIEKYSGTSTDATLKNRINKAIKQMKKWKLIKDKQSGVKNAKVLMKNIEK